MVEQQRALEIVHQSLEWQPNPTLMIDMDGQAVAANQSLKDLFPHWRVGVHFTSLSRDPELLKACRWVAEGGGDQALELILGGGDKEQVFQVIVRGPLSFDNQQLVLVQFTEVTEAREAEKMRSAFVANVSHELRSPLTTLMGAANALKTMITRSTNNDPKMIQFLDMMMRESTRMNQLISDLLALSKTESREHIRPTEHLDLRDIIRQTAEMLALRASELGKKIELSSPEDLPKVRGDSGELQQVFYNLTENALKYGAADGAVTISLSVKTEPHLNAPKGVLEVSVHNWGKPIPMTHQPRLTERFYRMEEHRAREEGGTGLGLAIVKHIVSRHDGHLLIESTAEMGTSFKVQLPLIA